jgi:hypothetical protein
MANRFRIRLLVLLAGAALAASAVPARADWLVTKDGARLETKGPWKVEGRRVVFTLPNGMLSALRADDVDLDQSAAVTAHAVDAAKKAAEPKPEPKKAPILTLTEKDIPPSPSAGEDTGDDTAAADQSKTAAASGSDLQVISWDKTPTADETGIEVFGTIKNNGQNNITSPSIMVAIYDAAGGLLASNDGSINAGMIAPGKTANFRASFPGIPDFTAAKFDVQGRGFKTNTSEQGTDQGDQGTETTVPQYDQQQPPSI